MAHAFDGKLYFTRDHMQGNFIPKNLKLLEPKLAPKPQGAPLAQCARSAGAAQLFGCLAVLETHTL